MSKILIDMNRMEELYKVLYEEKGSADLMISTLIKFKENLEEQGIDRSSLGQVHYYTDTLINLMEILSKNITTLQDNATEIAEQFAQTDQTLAAYHGMPSSGITSYESYEVKQLQKEYGMY
ncbi:hypothetical protein SPD48_15905 [Pseudogracilibacillus sp. SE30717A]|uniref:hypothetical protein n=1 Tax=Pseudogracilibacillus sp. SE30717A TaxID=3098293 RepID=UPI00300E07BE